MVLPTIVMVPVSATRPCPPVPEKMLAPLTAVLLSNWSVAPQRIRIVPVFTSEPSAPCTLTVALFMISSGPEPIPLPVCRFSVLPAFTAVPAVKLLLFRIVRVIPCVAGATVLRTKVRYGVPTMSRLFPVNVLSAPESTSAPPAKR